MRTVIYPGSFDPFHLGHREVVDYGLQIADKVIVAVGINPAKPPKDLDAVLNQIKQACRFGINSGVIEVVSFNGLLADYVAEQNKSTRKINGVLKGLRNTTDFEYEKTQQYWNTELGLRLPTYYLIASKDLQHVSSTALRTIEAMRKK